MIAAILASIDFSKKIRYHSTIRKKKRKKNNQRYGNVLDAAIHLKTGHNGDRCSSDLPRFVWPGVSFLWSASGAN